MATNLVVTLHRDRISTVYNAGEIISGTLILDVTQQTIILKEILVQFLGKADCSWGFGRHSRQGIERFFNHQIRLLHPSGNDGHVSFGIGRHLFDLSCHLPPTLPGSFQGRKGEINYKIKILILPSAICEFQQVSKHPFEITDRRIIPFHTQWRQSAPVEVSQSFKIWMPKIKNCCCGKSTIVNWTIFLPRSDYCIGDCVPFYMNFENKSHKILHGFIIQLLQRVEYIASYDEYNDSDENYDKIVIFSQKFEQNLRGPETISCNNKIQLPNEWLTCSSYGTCRTITVRYFLRFEVKVGSHKFHQNVPIVIGNVRQ